MSDRSAMPGLPEARSPIFSTTSWSMVLAASDTKSPRAALALERLCRGYWYPIYAYVRRKGYATHDAQDLTQEFFSRLLGRNYLSVADRQRGKFRSFLLGSLEHFLAREWTKARAQKRGGGQAIFSLDEAEAEDRYRREPSHELTPEKIYNRRWAIALLDRAMSRLRDEYATAEKSELFARFESHLSGEPGGTSYAEIAQAVGMSEGAIKVVAYRLRRRFGELVRAEIADTVADPNDADEELQYLFRMLKN